MWSNLNVEYFAEEECQLENQLEKKKKKTVQVSRECALLAPQTQKAECAKQAN